MENIFNNKSFKYFSLNSSETIGGIEKPLNEIIGSGIIPFDIYKDTCYFLLGFDPSAKRWKVFGGGKEQFDKTSRDIAFREAVEESCKENSSVCYIPIEDEIANSMKKGEGVVVPSGNKYGRWFNNYFIRIDLKKWIRKYHASQVNTANQILRNEVSMIKWFSENNIKDLFFNKNQSLGQLHEPLVPLFASFNLCEKLKKHFNI